MTAMEAAPNRRSYIRLAAVRSLLMGLERDVVCGVFGRTDRVVRLWIHQFNQGGIDALTTKSRSGRPRIAKFKELQDLLVPVLEDPSKAGQVHWTGVRVHGYLKEELCRELSYRTTIRWLHELDFHLRVPQPWPEKQNQEDRETFRAELELLSADPKVELWFSDECGVEGDPRPRRRWSQPGKTRRVGYLGTHIRQNVIGAVAPKSGDFFSLVVNGVDTDVFQYYLDKMAETIPKKTGIRQIIILDNASWHRSGRLNWHHFEPKFLPSYSPDFNPIERLWLRLKADWFYDYVSKSSEELTDRLCDALKSLIDQKEKVSSICSIRK